MSLSSTPQPRAAALHKYDIWVSSNPAAEGASTPAHAKPARSGDPGLRHASIDWDEFAKSQRAISAALPEPGQRAWRRT
jgi:hypothetical protein